MIFHGNSIVGLSLGSLVFEFWTELLTIAPSTFKRLQLEYVVLARFISFIGASAFSYCRSLCCVHFDCPSSLWQLSSNAFSHLKHVSAITIPASVKQIRVCPLMNTSILLAQTTARIFLTTQH
jgi:hypothetical protein